MLATALNAAAPTATQWPSSYPPRYIFTGDKERTIRSCGEDHTGVRDRAILKLLATLALRAWEIVGVLLNDNDRSRALIHASGKPRREGAMPLPQDVSDVFYTRVTTVRPLIRKPKFEEEKMFRRMWTLR